MNNSFADIIAKYFGQAAEGIFDLLTGYTDEQALQLMDEAAAIAKARAAYQAERTRQTEGRKADQEKTRAMVTRCNPHYTINPKAAHRPRDLIQEG